MRANSLTAPERLAPLMPWIEGEKVPRRQVLRLLSDFTGTASGVGAAGDYLGLQAEPNGPVTDRQLDRLRRDVLALLEAAVEEDVRQTAPPLRSLPSLRFGVGRSRTRPAKLPRGASARAEVTGPGAFRLLASGRLRDVVLYAVMRTLTEPGAVTLSRCPAPAPNDWTTTCGRLVVGGRRVGRPPVFCSSACLVRAARQRKSETRKGANHG